MKGRDFVRIMTNDRQTVPLREDEADITTLPPPVSARRQPRRMT